MEACKSRNHSSGTINSDVAAHRTCSFNTEFLTLYTVYKFGVPPLYIITVALENCSRLAASRLKCIFGDVVPNEYTLVLELILELTI